MQRRHGNPVGDPKRGFLRPKVRAFGQHGESCSLLQQIGAQKDTKSQLRAAKSPPQDQFCTDCTPREGPHGTGNERERGGEEEKRCSLTAAPLCPPFPHSGGRRWKWLAEGRRFWFLPFASHVSISLAISN